MFFDWKKYDIKSNYKMLIALLALFFSFLFFIFKKSDESPLQDIKVVEIEKVIPKEIHQSIKLIGKIKAKSATILNAQFPGILNIIVQSGSKVNKGTLIAKIESLEIEKRYNLLSSAEIIAKEQFERGKKLFSSGAFSKADLEALNNKWISSQKDLADAKHNFDKLQIIAPFDGMVGTYKQREGKQLQGNEPIVNFYDPSNVSVDFDIPANILPYIEAGQKVKINDKIYLLRSVQKMLEDDKHMSPASVDIICDNCIIGDNLSVELYVKSKDNVIVIPYDAIVIRGGKTFVYTVENDKATLKQVELGIREKDAIEIVSGLNSGEMIINKSVNRLSPGITVKIHYQDGNN